SRAVQRRPGLASRPRSSGPPAPALKPPASPAPVRDPGFRDSGRGSPPLSSGMRLLFAALLLASPLRSAGAPPNILLICIDDLRPELRCYGAGYIHSPNIDRLAAH